MSELKPLFELEGRPVMRGQELHIAPSYHWRAGARAKVERFHSDEEVQLRSDNGAVPTVPVRALSWSAHPDTVAMEQMAEAGLGRASQRDLAVWKAARAQPAQAGQVPELTSTEVNDACWAFVEALPHQLPGAIFNDLKPAIYAAICKYLEQSVLAKRVPQWLPIETAPKGQRVMVWIADKEAGENIAFAKVWFHADGTLGGGAEGFNGKWDLTHWMKLPEPPNGKN